MKKVLTMALLMLISMGAQAQKEVFEKYKHTDGVTTIRIPKFVMRMAARADKDSRGKADKVSSIRILACERPALAKKIREDAVAAYRRGGYEEMMRVKESGEQVVIYWRALKGGKNEFAILAQDDELAIVNVTGSLSPDDLDGLDGILN